MSNFVRRAAIASFAAVSVSATPVAAHPGHDTPGGFIHHLHGGELILGIAALLLTVALIHFLKR